jgi:hypothetical protein
MKKAAEYHAHAKQCRSLAAQMDTEEQREQLLRMAEIWEKMAQERDSKPDRGDEGQ